MTTVHLRRETSASPASVWEVLTDFAGYARWMPMTRMELDPGRPQLGWGFTGVSGLGPLALRDSMLVSAWTPPSGAEPGVFRVVKTGRVLGGWAEVTVRPSQTGGSEVDWLEELVVRPLPFERGIGPIQQRFAEWLYGRAIDAMLAEALAAGSGASR